MGLLMYLTSELHQKRQRQVLHKRVDRVRRKTFVIENMLEEMLFLARRNARVYGPNLSLTWDESASGFLQFILR